MKLSFSLPFKLSKIIIVSTAEGVEQEKTNKKWNFNIFQNNDIYFYIDKNEEFKTEKQMYIESISIENIRIVKAPKIGEVITYMPNSSEGRLYDYSEDYIVDERLKYKGGARSNSKILEIGNQGGNATIRFSNTNIGKYESDEDEQIIHDGTLIKKIEKTTDHIKFTVAFDFIITINKNKYKHRPTHPYGPSSKQTKERRTGSSEDNCLYQTSLQDKKQYQDKFIHFILRIHL